MVSMYNSEGYKDPGVYEALTRVEAEESAARAAAAYRPLYSVDWMPADVGVVERVKEEL